MKSFTTEQREEIKEIILEHINYSKELKELLDMLTRRRRYTKLTGHTKVSSERKCECGSHMINVGCGTKSGGWSCPKEENEWKYIFWKLGSKED